GVPSRISAAATLSGGALLGAVLRTVLAFRARAADRHRRGTDRGGAELAVQPAADGRRAVSAQGYSLRRLLRGAATGIPGGRYHPRKRGEARGRPLLADDLAGGTAPRRMASAAAAGPSVVCDGADRTPRGKASARTSAASRGRGHGDGDRRAPVPPARGP